MKDVSTSPARVWSRPAMTALVLLRFAIGWHLLYEGLVKLGDPNWTSAGYLKSSQWVLAEWLHRVAADPTLLRVTDLLNMWGLTLIGLGLLLGCLSRLAAFFGAVLLALYYMASPPFLAGLSGLRPEGSYLLVDKNLVEMMALLVLAVVPTGRFLGLDGLLRDWRARRAAGAAQGPGPAGSAGAPAVARRDLFRHAALLPGVGAFAYAYERRRGWESFEVKHLLEWERRAEADGMSGATIKTFRFTQLDELKGVVPRAKIGNLELSRMFLGGNLIGGWAHARDLIYASDLVKAYHTDQKVFETFHLAERCGMNAILTNPVLCRVITAYWRQEGGKIQFISDCGGAKDGALEGARISIDAGASACYVQGATADDLVARGDLDTLARFLELVRQNGLPAGIGAHRLETVRGCVDGGLRPDFWMKTLHHTNYWSAKPQPECDNIWCVNPDETIAYMAQLKEPWIAFKTLAAGAIHPREGFAYAFKGGADFVCVGMYDFQLVDNVNTVLDVLQNVGERPRPWCA